jgi:hypothetical protein
MTATEPIQGIAYPTPTDAPDGPNQMHAQLVALLNRGVPRFVDVEARNAALGATPTDGMVAVTGSGASTTLWIAASGWKLVYSPSDDTGWVPLTFNSPTWANYGGSYEPAAVRRIGKLVKLRGMCRNSVALTGATTYAIGTIPSEFGPPFNHVGVGVTGAWNRVSAGASTGTAHTHNVSMQSLGTRVDITQGGTINLSLATSDIFNASSWISLSDIQWLKD